MKRVIEEKHDEHDEEPLLEGYETQRGDIDWDAYKQGIDVRIASEPMLLQCCVSVTPHQLVLNLETIIKYLSEVPCELRIALKQIEGARRILTQKTKEIKVMLERGRDLACPEMGRTLWNTLSFEQYVTQVHKLVNKYESASEQANPNDVRVAKKRYAILAPLPCLIARLHDALRDLLRARMSTETENCARLSAGKTGHTCDLCARQTVDYKHGYMLVDSGLVTGVPPVMITNECCGATWCMRCWADEIEGSGDILGNIVKCLFCRGRGFCLTLAGLCEDDVDSMRDNKQPLFREEENKQPPPFEAVDGGISGLSVSEYANCMQAVMNQFQNLRIERDNIVAAQTAERRAVFNASKLILPHVLGFV